MPLPTSGYTGQSVTYTLFNGFSALGPGVSIDVKITTDVADATAVDAICSAVEDNFTALAADLDAILGSATSTLTKNTVGAINESLVP